MFLFIYVLFVSSNNRKQKNRAVSWQRNSGSGQENKIGKGEGEKRKSSKKHRSVNPKETGGTSHTHFRSLTGGQAQGQSGRLSPPPPPGKGPAWPQQPLLRVAFRPVRNRPTPGSPAAHGPPPCTVPAETQPWSCRSDAGRRRSPSPAKGRPRAAPCPLPSAPRPPTSGFRLLTSRTEFPAPARPGMPMRPAAAAAAAAEGMARGASAPCTLGTDRPGGGKKAR